MGQIVFIGLGLDGEKGITLRGLDEARSADLVFAELYTSALPGASLEAVEKLIDRKIRRLTRQEVEDGQVLLAAAAKGAVAFLVPGDAIASLLQMASALRTTQFGPHTLACVLSRVGSPEVRALAGPIGELADRDLGPPPHSLVIPGTLHFLEKDALVAFAGAPHDL